MTPRGRKGGLPEADAALWARVLAQVRPLPGRAPPPVPAPPAVAPPPVPDAPPSRIALTRKASPDLAGIEARLARRLVRGVAAIDAVFTALNDLDGLATESEAAKRVGFAAKAAIHPAQVAVINQCFMPSVDEVRQAQRIVEAFAAAPASGVVRLDGQMLDQPHRRWAEGLLALRDAATTKP